MTLLKSKSGKIIERRYPRKIINRMVGVLAGGTYKILNAIELSEGGMLVDGDHPHLQRGSKAVLTFRIQKGRQGTNGSEAIVMGTVTCRAVYEDEQGRTGFEFLDLSFENQRRIRQIVALQVDEDTIYAGSEV